METSGKLRLILFAIALILGVRQQSHGQQNQETLALNVSARNSLIENIAFGNSHPLLVELLAQAGLAPLLSSPEPYTFFIPSEEACEKLRGQKPEMIRLVLSYHLVKGSHPVQSLKEGARLRTIMGESISVLRKKEDVFINGARVVGEDNVSRNGICHHLDNLLLPKQRP
jgi:uncharacterized surface protein with fasciclin (FAS1) repeats